MVMGIMAVATVALAAIGTGWFEGRFGVSADRWNDFSPFAYAWAGGLLGGSLFSAKWLVHTVARGTWNQDRFAWRLATPFLGAGAALAVIALSLSRIVPILDDRLVRDGGGAVGVAIVVGFVADKTMSRLEGFAKRYLGDKK